MKKLGVIVNPVAGMGGKVGLKGSDGLAILNKAREMGSQPEAPKRTIQALEVISRIKEEIDVITYPCEMGEDELRTAGFNPAVIGSIKSGETTPIDTIRAAQKMVDAGVDLLLFAGGDGTARNIYSVVGNRIPVLGIPAGVKMHSAVYAINPRNAGEAAALYLEGKVSQLREAEVMDIDEDAFRMGRVSAKLFGYLQIPEVKNRTQNVKAGSYSEADDLYGLAEEVVENMEKNTLYILGPGTTTRSISERLDLTNTLLGVDVVLNNQLLVSDANEHELGKLLHGKKAKMVVTVIGGQGHVFGRGNQQISPQIIKMVGKQNIIIVATEAKLISIPSRQLLVDTGDPELDQALCGIVRVVTGYEKCAMCRVSM